ncbi:hypothetical protein K474DRAFT_1674705 [Panus rudis PR-1116 ss-1]|nr:hypothetical protein K474DRAFT_1674705 [Panus rudis PR-1116 ss-1]
MPKRDRITWEHTSTQVLLIKSVYDDLMLQTESYGTRSRHDALLFCLHEVSTTFVREVNGLSISSGSLGECLGNILLRLCNEFMLGPDPDTVLAGRVPAEVHRVAMPDLGGVESQLCRLEASLASCHHMLACLEDMLVCKEKTVCPPQFRVILKVKCMAYSFEHLRDRDSPYVAVKHISSGSLGDLDKTSEDTDSVV